MSGNKKSPYRSFLLLGLIVGFGSHAAFAQMQTAPLPLMDSKSDTASTASAIDELELSLETAILFSLNGNPDLGMVSEQSEQSRYAVDEARSIFYPHISATGAIGVEYNNPAAFAEETTAVSNTNKSREYTFQVNQMVFDGYASSSELKRRKQLFGSSELQALAMEQKIVLDTIQAYLDVYRYQKLFYEANKLIGHIKVISGLVDLMVEAGAESAAKQKYVKSRLSYAKSEKNNAEASLADSIADLEFLTGKLPRFTAKRPEIVDVLSISKTKYLEIALKNNPTWLLNESDKKAARFALDKVDGKYYPKVNVVMEYNKSKDIGGEIGNDDSASVMLQMNYDIFDGFGRDATKKRVTSEVREYDYKAQRIQRDIKQKIRSSHNQIIAYETDLATVEEEIITNRELQELYAEQFELGEGQIINIIEGEERLYRSLLRQQKIEVDILYNAYEMIQNVGLLEGGYFIAEQ